jgi:cobalamin biosynthetic protein CobC
MLEHGGNLSNAAAQYGIPLENWLDLSTGINPNGYPVPAIPPALWQRLPLTNDGLIEAAQTYFGTQHILATAGSQAAIQTLPKLRPACNVAMPNTMYAEHARSWIENAHTIHNFIKTPDAALLNKVDVVVVCNPNNPTGTIIQPEVLLAWHAQLSQKGGWLVVDEAFMDATPEFSLSRHAHLPGLIVLRSLGKFFGLAGARIGFALAENQLLTTLEDTLGPWPVSGPARFIATHALQNSTWQKNTRKNLLEDSQRLNALLYKYGLNPSGSTLLFQWVQTNDAQALQIHFAQHGIWVRLHAEWSALRFGLPPDNGWTRLEAALLKEL